MGYDIKKFKPNKKGKYTQGYFPLNESSKYKGTGPVIYRSSWEKKFCMYCESNPDIKWWSSETISIKYYSPLDQKMHEYFPDFILETTGGIVIVEVKPKYRLTKPLPPKRKSPKSYKKFTDDMKTYQTNLIKKQAGEEYASRIGGKYLIVTEDFFKPRMQ